MTPGKVTLDDEFAAWKAQSRLVRCYTCKLDPELRAFIHRMRDSGESLRSIAHFMTNVKGVRVTDGALKNHFDGGHPG